MLKFLTVNVASVTIDDIPDFQMYTDVSVSDRECDTLKWWSSNKHLYPITAAAARQFLAVPATYAQSERQFSAAG